MLYVLTSVLGLILLWLGMSLGAYLIAHLWQEPKDKRARKIRKEAGLDW
jgi:hypothetical protein